MIRINIEYKSGVSKNGVKYKIPYTYDFGYGMAIQCNGNVKVQRDNQGLYVVYDPHFAIFGLNDKGYPVLKVVAEESLKGGE